MDTSDGSSLSLSITCDSAQFLECEVIYSDSYWNENLCDGMGAVTQKYKISQAGNLQAIRVVQSSVLTVRSSMVIQILMSLSSSQMGL